MKRLFICLFVLLIGAAANFAMAQDVVYLKNGSVIKGSVVEIKPSESLKIKTADGSLFVYKMSEVDRIERDNNASSRNNGSGDSDVYLKRGFRGFVDFGGSLGFGDTKQNYQGSISFTGGYQINSMLFVGGGVAPTVNFNDFDQTICVVPLYAAVRLDFLKNKVSPYINARAGYSINTDNPEYSAAYFYGGVGVRLRKFNLGAGTDVYTRDGNTSTYASFRFGFEF